VNLSLQIEKLIDLLPIEIFLNVTSKEQGCYSSFLQFNDTTNNPTSFISNSPELFIKRIGNQVTTAPIKGTISRARGYLENEERLHELLTSTKNKAELAMIVDLFRNDLSKICHPGSVQVSDFPQTITLQYIHHLYCNISGQIRDEVSDRVILDSLFPSGSITGAPKYTAIQTIADLEKRNRGIYCGSFISFSKDGFIANVAIRTATLRNKTLILQAGGGITIDSIEQEELIEAQKKLSAFYS
jgi:para-aminobenzoate synthetase component 1